MVLLDGLGALKKRKVIDPIESGTRALPARSITLQQSMLQLIP
jgi:hypothetical protein